MRLCSLFLHRDPLFFFFEALGDPPLLTLIFYLNSMITLLVADYLNFFTS